MAKYRGKFQGRTRGKYVSRAFISNQDSVEQNFDFAREVNIFMENKGVHVNSGRFDDPAGDFWGDTNSYHIGGATVDVKRKDYEKESNDRIYGNHFVRIKMVSNDSLDDIVEMALKKFPSFKETNFGIA